MSRTQSLLLARITATLLPVLPGVGAAQALPAPDGIAEVLVTAQRRTQPLLEVPLSVTSFTSAQLQQQGIQQIEDLARLTPGLRFTRTAGVSGNNGADISLRGIASDVGSATTAIYIDDTPIQIRSIGYFGGNAYPLVFDLERIEVLRGPQGTLFGAGAEGGAVRFLTPQPDGRTALNLRSEVATVRHGGTAYEMGIAGGTALGAQLGMRGSLWYRQGAGYIDRASPSGATLLARDINRSDNYSARLAAAWRASARVTVTPSFYYQKVTSGGRAQFWEARGDPTAQDYVTGIYNGEPWRDSFALPALRVEYGGDAVQIISSTSLFQRDRTQLLDYATFLSTLRSGNPFGSYANKEPGNAVATQTLTQRNVVQELRVQSRDAAARLSWTAGLFYSRARQRALNLSASGRTPGVLSSGFPQYLGRYNLLDDIDAIDEQHAGFASLDLRPGARLTLTAGLRASRNVFDFTELRDGPVNGGARTLDRAQHSDTALTPRLAVSWPAPGGTLWYASAAQGFRPGGAQAPVDPAFCAADLRSLGLSGSPRDYEADSLWSYEAGSKGRMLRGTLLFDVNAWYARWRDIQQSIRLPTCSFGFIANLGSASGRGVDLTTTLRLPAALQLGASLGYHHVRYDERVTGGNGVILREAGDRIGGPQWSGALFLLGEAPLRAHGSAYLRADYSFQSHGSTPNPAAFGYDPGLGRLPGAAQLSLRLGMKRSAFDLSLFASNLTAAHPALARAHDALGSPLYFAESYAPRTVGITLRWGVE